jgi:hypothetical protein
MVISGDRIVTLIENLLLGAGRFRTPGLARKDSISAENPPLAETKEGGPMPRD